jgi:hypothetical protein
MPDIQKGKLKIAGYAVDEGEWSSRVNVWGNEAILRSRASLPVSLNQIVNVTYEQGGNVYTLIQNGLVNRIEVREEAFGKYYEYTVWGREWVGKYRITSETGTVEAATAKLQKYCQILGLIPTFYNMSGVTIVPNAIGNEYIADIIDNIRTSAYTYSTDNIPFPVTINYYFKTDGNPVFFVGTIGSLTLNTPLTYRERTEDLSNVYNQVTVWSQYHPVKDTFDLFTDSVAGSYRYWGQVSWWKRDWTSWQSLIGDSNNKVYGNISLKTGPIPAVADCVRLGDFRFDSCDMEAFVRIPSNAGSLAASSLTGFFIVIGTSLNPKSASGATSIDLKGKIFLGPDPMETPTDDKRYIAAEVSFYATTILTWHTFSLFASEFAFKNKIKDEERSTITLDYVHIKIKNPKRWMAGFKHTPEEFTFWFDKGYLTEVAGIVVVDSESQAQYGIRELASEEIGYEPKTAKRYADMIAKGKSLLRPKPEGFYSRIEIPATISPPTLGYYYTLVYRSTVATGLLTELRLEVREDDAPKWVLTLTSSPDYPARTKLYKKLEKLDSAVRFLLNAPGYVVTPVEGVVLPYLAAGEITASNGYLSVGYAQNFQASLVQYIGSIATIENIGSLNVDYIGYIGEIGTIGNAYFQNISRIDQIGSVGNANFQNINYVGQIGAIGTIGTIDRLTAGRIDRIDRIDYLNYANIVQANITNIGALQNLTTAYLNVTNIATLASATITNAYVKNIGHISTLSADNLFVSNIGSIGSAYITNANITNISSLNSASIGIAYISVIQNVATLTCNTANITHIGGVQDLRATTAYITNISNVSNLTASTASISNILGVNSMSVTLASISNIVGVSNFYAISATINNANITNISSLSSATIGSANIGIITGVATLTASTANINYIQNVQNLSCVSANISNISGVANLTASTANISIIRNVSTITANNANITNLVGVQSLTATTLNVTNLIASNATISGSATIGNVIATNAQLSGSIKTDKIVALTTQITIGSPGQQVYIPVPSTIINLYGTSITMKWGTVDTVLIGTISASSISFKIGTVDTFYIGSASASVMKFSIGTVNNINITGLASGNQLSFTSGTIGNLNVTGVETVNTLSVSSATIGRLNVTATASMGTVSIISGTIGNLNVTGTEVVNVLSVSSATITNCNITSTGVINVLSVTSGTITNLNVTATEKVATLSVTSGTIEKLNVTATATIGTFSVSSGTITNLNVTSNAGIANLNVTSYGTIANLNVTSFADIRSMNVRSGTIGTLNVTVLTGINQLNISSATIGQLNVTGYGHIGTFDLDVGTIDSAQIVIGTLNYATITATSVRTAYISISTIDSCTIKFGTISSLYAITENVSTLNVTARGSLSFATISAAQIGGLNVFSATLTSCTITSGRIGNVLVSASTITKLQITTPLIGKGVIRADNLVFLPVNWYPNSDFEFVDDVGNVLDWSGITRVSPGFGDVGYAGVVAPYSYAWANVTLDVQTGEFLRFKGYTKSRGGHGFALKLLDVNYNPISTTPILLGAAADWLYRSFQAPITVAGVYHAVPGLYAGPQPATFDQISLSKDVGSINIGDGQVTAPKIAADAVQTSHIRFDPMSESDPSDPSLTLWYRSDYDQLRFGGPTGQIGIIKRYPMTEFNTPPENLVLNPFFEEDIDYDGVPDYWTPPPGTKGTDWGTSTASLRGKRCVWSRISTSGTYREWLSEKIPVRPGQKLYARCYARASAGYTPNIGIIHIAWYAPDGTTYLGEVTSPVKALGTTWAIHEVSATVPSDGTYAQNVRYARIHLYAGNVAIYITYFDDITLSELRGASATPFGYSITVSDWQLKTITPGNWDQIYISLPVASTDALIEVTGFAYLDGSESDNIVYGFLEVTLEKSGAENVVYQCIPTVDWMTRGNPSYPIKLSVTGLVRQYEPSAARIRFYNFDPYTVKIRMKLVVRIYVLDHYHR